MSPISASDEESPFSDDEQPNRVEEALFLAIFKLVLSRARRFTAARPLESEAELVNPVDECDPGLMNLLRSDPKLADTWIAERKHAQPEIAKLCSYFGHKELAKEGIADLIVKYSRWGFKPGQAALAARLYLERKKGRPVSVRHIAVHALELRLADPKKWPWTRLARKLCPCSKPNHDAYCTQNIRQAVLALKKLLQKHGVYPEHGKDI